VVKDANKCLVKVGVSGSKVPPDPLAPDCSTFLLYNEHFLVVNISYLNFYLPSFPQRHNLQVKLQ